METSEVFSDKLLGLMRRVRFKWVEETSRRLKGNLREVCSVSQLLMKHTLMKN
jgi:hypothetical protein